MNFVIDATDQTTYNGQTVQPVIQETNTTVSGVEPVEVLVEDKKKEAAVEELMEDIRVQAFLKYYYDKTEKDTFGNRTQAYIKAFNLDVNTQYNSARVLGSRLLAKVSMSARDYLESTGWGLPTLIELNKKKAIETDSAKYLEMLYEVGEYKQPTDNGSKTINAQVNNYGLDAPELKDFNANFLKFLENS